jgi:hypothetical protein
MPFLTRFEFSWKSRSYFLFSWLGGAIEIFGGGSSSSWTTLAWFFFVTRFFLNAFPAFITFILVFTAF